MNEKRTLKRRALVDQLEVRDVESGDVLGRLVDITPQGFLLVGPRPVETGRTYQARLELPEEIRGRSRVDLAVTSVWSKPDVNPRLFVSGFQISQATTDDVETIAGLIARHLLPV